MKNPPNPLNPRLKNEYRIRIKETASSGGLNQFFNFTY